MNIGYQQNIALIGLGLTVVVLSESLFPEVKWEDEEPTEVELVKKE